MKNTILILTVLCLLMSTGGCVSSSQTAASKPSEKEQLIRKIMQLQIPPETGSLLRRRGTPKLGDLSPTLSQNKDDRLLDEELRDALIEGPIPIYDAYFSEEELRQLLEIYQTKLFRKLSRFNLERSEELTTATSKPIFTFITTIMENMKKEPSVAPLPRDPQPDHSEGEH